MSDRTLVFFIGHNIHCKTMSVFFNSVLYFPYKYHIVMEEKGELLITTKYIAISFIQFQRSLLV